MEHVERDAGVGHPGRPGVPQAVPGEVLKPEAFHEVVPAGRVAHGRGGEHAAAWATQERIVGLLVGGEAFEDGFESVEDRHEARGVLWSA